MTDYDAVLIIVTLFFIVACLFALSTFVERIAIAAERCNTRDFKAKPITRAQVSAAIQATGTQHESNCDWCDHQMQFLRELGLEVEPK